MDYKHRKNLILEAEIFVMSVKAIESLLVVMLGDIVHNHISKIQSPLSSIRI